MTDLDKTLKALTHVKRELAYHIHRLEDKLRAQTADTHQEADHLEDLVTGYRTAHHYVNVLLRYTRGRLRGPTGATLPDDAGDGAQVDDTDSPS